MAPKSTDDLLKQLNKAIPDELKGAKKGGNDSILIKWIADFIDNMQRQPPLTQSAVGGAGGLVSGYLFTKGSKATATVLGISLIAFQFLPMDHLQSLPSVSPQAAAIALASLGAYALTKLAQWLVPGPQHRVRFDFKDKTVLITGASAGLGKEIARELYRRGARLILVARSIDKLKEVVEELKAEDAQGAVRYEPVYCYLDLADPEKVEDLAKLSHNGKIDCLVNNAGISMRGSVMDTDMKVQRQVMEVNFFGQVTVTRALLPFIPDDGCIVLISSLQSKMPIPYRSAYSASKHAVVAFFDSLRCEERFGLHIMNVVAGYINTNLGSHALDTSGKPMGAAAIESSADQLTGMAPEVVAKMVADGVEQRKLEITPAPFKHRIGIFLRWLWPSLYFFLVHKRGLKDRKKE